MTLRSNLATVVACVLIPLGLASPSPAAGEREPLAELIGGAKAEVRATQALSTKGEGVVPPGVARFPLRWRPKVDAADVRAVLRDVHHGDWRDQELAGHFEPRLENIDGTAVLLVEIDRAPPVERGTYALVVDLIGPATKELPSGERDELNLEIVLSAAEIKTSPAVTLRHVLGIRGAETVLPKLRLQEVSGRSFLSRLSAPQEVPLLDEDSVPTPASLRVQLPAALSAHADAPYQLTIDGEPPLGTTTAAVRIRAPELAEPVDVAVTVVTRRSGFVLVVAIVVGVLCGFVSRKLLAVWGERQSAKLQAGKMLDLLKKEHDAGGDKTFLDRVRKLQVTVAEAAEGPPEKVPDEISQTQTELTKLIAGLNDRLQAARQKRAVLEATLADAPADLPGNLAALITDAAADLKKTADQMNRAGFAEASRAHQRIEEDTAKALRTPVRGLATDTRNRALRLRTSLYSPLAAKELESVSEPLIAVLATAEELAGSADDLDLAGLLDKTEEMLEANVRLASRISTGILYTVEESVANLQKLGETGETAALRTAASRFRDAVEAADGSGEVLEVVRDSHWDLDKSLRKAILAQVPAGQDPDEIESELNQGHYAAVLRRLLLIRDSSPAFDVHAQLSDAGDQHDAPDLPELFRRLWKGRGRSRSAPVVGSGAPIASPGFPAIDPVLTAWSLLGVRFLQSGLALVVITAAGYFLFEEEWTGTWRQMLGIVAWGFGLDLGLDKAMEVAGPVHKPSA